MLLDCSDEDSRLLFTYPHEQVGLAVGQRYLVDQAAYYVVTATTTNARFAAQSPELDAVLESFAVEDPRRAGGRRAPGARTAPRIRERRLRGGGSAAARPSPEAPDGLAETIGALPEALVGSWCVGPVGPADDPPLEALDGGAEGRWQILAGDGPLVALAATSGRLLWLQLAGATALGLRGESG